MKNYLIAETWTDIYIVVDKHTENQQSKTEKLKKFHLRCQNPTFYKIK